MTNNLRATYLNGIQEAETASKAYYVDGADSPLTDDQYDVLVEQLVRLGEANGWTEHVKLVEQVAAGAAAGNGDVTHRARMLSLSKAQNEDELQKFIGKMDLHSAKLLIEPKLDGLAIVANYVDGKLVQVATRGDSRTGQNVTARAKQATIKGLPNTIPFLGDIEFRGELFITRKDFEIAQTFRTKQGRELFKNPRNAVSGTIQSKDVTRLEGLTMTFGVYDVIHYSADALTADDSYTAQLAKIQKAGFITATSLIPVLADDTLYAKVKEFGDIRNSLDIPTDGVVVKIDSVKLREKLGHSERHPYWAIAYKYEAEVKETTLLGITRNVGRTGAISYVANFAPVELAETEVTKATLNNARFIAELDLHIGDRILVRKANEIIPEIIGVNFVARDGKNLTPYEAPVTCPNCGSQLDTTSSVVWRCLNPECAQANGIIHAVSRDHLDIEGLSTSIVERLVEEEFIQDVTDLYTLSVNKLASLPMGGINKDGTKRALGQTVAKKLVANIQGSKSQPLNRILSSLGVRFMGRTFGRRFALHFKTFDAAVNATVEQMQQVDGVKDKAVDIRAGLNAQQVLLAKYRQVGFEALSVAAGTATAGDALAASSALLEGQSVVITGGVPGFSRTEAKELIEDNGGTAGSSVSAKTTLLVAPADERETSKAKKAQQLGIRIVTPEEFLALLGK
jgi:DNA ligase (NAD+)